MQKLRINMKSPDCIHCAISEYSKDLTEEEQVWVLDELSKFIDGEEYIEIEFDLEAGTAKVLEVE